ncbi:MAG: lipopolysaccharide assembly protein LapA domain-containing protein [Gemmobacter sp.]
MIRYVKYLFLALLAATLVIVALANRDPVTLRALPTDLAAVAGVDWSIELPLFLVIFGGLAGGLMIGFLWEWLREMKHRSIASRKIREVSVLERELASLRDAKGAPADDVLALMDRRKAS